VTDLRTIGADSALLQRGRGPETAESSEAGVTSVTVQSLQRGRGPETAESREKEALALRREDASTGPRSGDRGEVDQPGRPGNPRGASTGPRSGDRGEAPAHDHLRFHAKRLQRGRGPETAESLLWELKNRVDDMLQRGRGPETAESRPSMRAMMSRENCFNGAAVRRPRRAEPAPDEPPGKKASTGPRSGDRGEGAT
jgi:hypothetical protein